MKYRGVGEMYIIWLFEDFADDGGHEAFFAGLAFGDHEGDGDEGAVGDF